MDAIEKRARELLASCLDEWGHPCEAENVRQGEDLESYEAELRLISQLLHFGIDTAEGHGRAVLSPAEGYVVVSADPTAAMIAAAEDAHMPFGYMGFAISAAIAARPEVPGA